MVTPSSFQMLKVQEQPRRLLHLRKMVLSDLSELLQSAKQLQTQNEQLSL